MESITSLLGRVADSADATDADKDNTAAHTTEYSLFMTSPGLNEG
jgi:hypothetical protein